MPYVGTLRTVSVVLLTLLLLPATLLANPPPGKGKNVVELDVGITAGDARQLATHYHGLQ